MSLRKRAKIKETTINDFELRYQHSIVGYSPENSESVKQYSGSVWASLISSLGVAWYDCSLCQFFSYVSTFSRKYQKLGRNSCQTCYFLTSLLPICVSLLWSGWNRRHHFQIFLLLHWVTSAVTATLYDFGNSSYWNTKFEHHLFLSLQEFYLNKDKLKLKYHISNLMMKRDLETKKKMHGLLL